MLLLNVPLAEGKKFGSVVDLLNLEVIEWVDQLGTEVKKYPLEESHPLFKEILRHREGLLDELSNYND